VGGQTEVSERGRGREKGLRVSVERAVCWVVRMGANNTAALCHASSLFVLQTCKPEKPNRTSHMQLKRRSPCDRSSVQPHYVQMHAPVDICI